MSTFVLSPTPPPPPLPPPSPRARGLRYPADRSAQGDGNRAEKRRPVRAAVFAVRASSVAAGPSIESSVRPSG
ncbi:Hypothetical protein CINCED_3A000088, partial [Cinara cedri]